MTRDVRHDSTIIDHRGLIGFSSGLAGFGIGLGAVVFDLIVLGLVAGICSFISAVTIVRNPSRAALSPSETEPVPELPGDSVAVALSRTDPAADGTQLLPGDYFEIAVRSRVMAARRFLKPLAVVRLRITAEDDTGLAGHADIAAMLATTLRECDTACILNTDEIGLVLEDTPENGAVWVVERIRRALADTLSCRLRAGVACYPAHAMDANELLEQVDLALERAAEWSQDRIEVAISE